MQTKIKLGDLVTHTDSGAQGKVVGITEWEGLPRSINVQPKAITADNQPAPVWCRWEPELTVTGFSA